jgi:hypothetical protein
MRIICCLSFIFILCAGCQTTSQDWPPADAHTTVKRTLPEVTNAILLSYRQYLGSETNKVTMKTNDIPRVSFTLDIMKYEGHWPSGGITATTIRATAINSNESSIAVRCASVYGDVFPCPVTRHRGVERRTLAAIIKTLNKEP